MTAAPVPDLSLASDPVRVLVVDDSAVSRRIVSEAIAGDPEIVVAGTAATGASALKRITQCRPDVITLDIEMPEMGGMEALRAIRNQFPNIRVIVISSRIAEGSADGQEALSLGASQCISKNLPSEDGPLGALKALRAKLQPSIKQLGRAARGLGLSPGTVVVSQRISAPAALPRSQAPSPLRTAAASAEKSAVMRRAAAFGTPEVFAIGVSTGGPTALHQIAPQIPDYFPLPVLIVQHMPAIFTRLLAERLQTVCALPVHEAADQMEIEPGHIYIAPGNYHMRVVVHGLKKYVALDQGAPEHSCRPAVDVLFRSLAQTYRGSVVAAVLTGMGQDGQLGCEALRASGAYILAQDEATSVVWGMPGGIARAGLADQVLPLNSIIPEVMGRCLSLVATNRRHGHSGARK